MGQSNSSIFWQAPPERSPQAVDARDPATPTDDSACPVDHQSRKAWLNAARNVKQYSIAEGMAPGLSVERQVSTIPRSRHSTTTSDLISSTSDPKHTTASSSTTASHGNEYSGSDEEQNPDKSAYWVYPSESQFYSALQRKHGQSGREFDPVDMKTIIPIHNAVNERTWSEILEWERPYTGPSSAQKLETPRRGEIESEIRKQQPKLVSFSGDSTKLTPRARLYTLMGYQKPFDRHDWVVGRPDGTTVEYVIDFYSGKASGSTTQRQQGPTFYLDVRPKLNSVEGWRMRVAKFLGWST